MLRRLCEQRRALSVYCSEVDGQSLRMWFRCWTVQSEVSSNAACISVIIYLVAILRIILSRDGNDAGVKTLKSSLLESVNEHFASIHEEPLYTISTLTDPRFKHKFFSEAVLTTVKATVILAVNGSSSTWRSATATVTTLSTRAALDSESVTYYSHCQRKHEQRILFCGSAWMKLLSPQLASSSR